MSDLFGGQQNMVGNLKNTNIPNAPLMNANGMDFLKMFPGYLNAKDSTNPEAMQILMTILGGMK